MSELSRTIVNTDKAPQPIGAYSQAIRTAPGELLFIAGQVAVDLEGNPVGVGDMAAQVRQVFDNLGGILESVGATFSNVVEFTTYVVGRDSVQAYIADLRGRHRPGAAAPVAGVGGFFTVGRRPRYAGTPRRSVPPNCRLPRLRRLKCVKSS